MFHVKHAQSARAGPTKRGEYREKMLAFFYIFSTSLNSRNDSWKK